MLTHVQRAARRPNDVRSFSRLLSGGSQVHPRGALLSGPSNIKRIDGAKVKVACAGLPDERAVHNQVQADKFSAPNTVKAFTVKLPDAIEKKLERIVGSVPGLGPESRIVDVGSGTGCLIPHMQARGVADILAVDLCSKMLDELTTRYMRVGTLGNELGVRTWVGDIVDLPAYLGKGCDAIFMNGCFGNMYSPREALLRCSLLVKPGGHVVISHPMGRTWHGDLHKKDSDMVPHLLPDRQALETMISGLPLKISEFVDEEDHYCVTLQVPQLYSFPSGSPPLLLEGPVVRGFGRGSRLMGVPTANIDPAALGDALKDLPLGVYYGWAKLEAPNSFASADSQVHKAVLNIGRRPTVNAGDEALSVEAHIMHGFHIRGTTDDDEDVDNAAATPVFPEFYGARLRVVLLGYIRPELKFPKGLPQLIQQIQMDIATSRNLLEEPENQAHKTGQQMKAPWK